MCVSSTSFSQLYPSLYQYNSLISLSPQHSEGHRDADCVLLSFTCSPGPSQSAWYMVGLNKQLFNILTLFQPSGKSLQLKLIPVA